jgi:hypothetical protein
MLKECEFMVSGLGSGLRMGESGRALRVHLLDGASWTEMGRQTNTQCFRASSSIAASFPGATPMECRFTRLTQTDTNHEDDHMLVLASVKLFGTLYE